MVAVAEHINCLWQTEKKRGRIQYPTMKSKKKKEAVEEKKTTG